METHIIRLFPFLFDALFFSWYSYVVQVVIDGINLMSQLAIIASYSGDEFAATYRYFRSSAVETPFPTARDNLIVAFEKVN